MDTHVLIDVVVISHLSAGVEWFIITQNTDEANEVVSMVTSYRDITCQCCVKSLVNDDIMTTLIDLNFLYINICFLVRGGHKIRPAPPGQDQGGVQALCQHQHQPLDQGPGLLLQPPSSPDHCGFSLC